MFLNLLWKAKNSYLGLDAAQSVCLSALTVTRGQSKSHDATTAFFLIAVHLSSCNCVIDSTVGVLANNK